LQFRHRFDVEAAHAYLQGARHLRNRFPDAGEQHLLRVAAGGDHPLEFAPGNDVETATEATHQFHDGEVAVGLERVAEGGVPALHCKPELFESRFDVASRIDIERGAELLGERV
jgi:hypothetical protein